MDLLPHSAKSDVEQMIDFLAPFQHQFMINGMLITAIVAVPMALLSCFMILKGWALLGDAMSHAVFPGVVLAYILGFPFAVGAFVAGLFCALATGFLQNNSRIKQDTVMGVVFSGMFAVGLVLFTNIRSDVHLDHVLFGHLLGVSPKDIVKTAAIAVLLTLVLVAKWRDFLLLVFDPMAARALGLRVTLLHYGLLTMISLAIVASLQAVGVILSISFLIAPGANAFLLSRRLSHMLILAVVIAVGTAFLGVYASFFIGSASAPTIVVVQALLFILIYIATVLRRQVGIPNRSIKDAAAS